MSIRFLRAKELHEQGQLDEALAIYQHLLLENPHQLDLLHAVAILYSQQKKHSEAIRAIENALTITDTRNKQALASLYNTLGNIYRRAGLLEKAIKALQTALTYHPNYAVIYSNLGTCYLALH